jgi:hypothetical protein
MSIGVEHTEGATFETSVSIHQSTRCNTPEDLDVKISLNSVDVTIQN